MDTYNGINSATEFYLQTPLPLPGPAELLAAEAELQVQLPYKLSWSQSEDEQADLAAAAYRFNQLQEAMDLFSQAFRSYTSNCREFQIEEDHAAVYAVEQSRKLAAELCQEHRKLLQPLPQEMEHGKRMQRIDQVYRAILTLQAPMARLLSWNSQSYKTSKIVQFFNGAKTKKEAVNYDRVQSPRVNLVEQQLSTLYGLDEEKVELLATCSGTAAFGILEKYLLLHVLKPGDKIYIAPTMYDEHQDWAFRGHEFLEVITEDIFDADQIVESIKKIAPKVVLIDPLKNRQDARMTDLAAILRQLRQTWHEDELFILIDDTMLPAAINPFKEVEGNQKLKILLCSSLGKYLQIGQDVCMAGLIAYPKEMSKRMKNIRMFHGTILCDANAWIFPKFDYEYHQTRMRRMTRNAILVAELLARDEELSLYFTPVHPARLEHPDHAIGQKFPFLGGTVNLRLIPQVENGRETLHDILDEMIMSIIEQAKVDGTSICWGEAVGFSVPRIGVHLEWLWRVPPYLRLVVGDRSIDETRAMAKSLITGLLNFLHKHRDLFTFSMAPNLPAAATPELATTSGQSSLVREDMSFFR